MTVRFGLFARLAASVAIGLMAVQLALVWIYIRDRAGGEEPGHRFPLPDRVAAIVEMIEAAEDADRALAALNGPDLRVALADDAVFDAVSPDVALPRLEDRFEDYAAVFGERPFAIFIDLPDDVARSELRRGDTTIWTRFPMRVLVGLSDGRVLTIETRDDLLTQVYSVPIGWFSGIFGLIASVIVLVLVRRETRPIETLAQAVERFGSDGRPVRVAERGAPELRSLIANFNAMQVRISDLMERQTVMLGALGHDLRTYLTRLSLKIEDVPERDRAALQANLDRMGAVVENSLALARGTRLAGTGEAVDLPAFLRGWVAERHDPRILLGSTQPAEIFATIPALDRVMTNLVENGLRFGSRVEIESGADPASIRVMDDGPGLPEDALRRVLEPFVTLDDARNLERSGTGLGLAIANLLVGDAGGTLTLSNRSPKGLCAEIVFHDARRASGPDGGAPSFGRNPRQDAQHLV